MSGAQQMERHRQGDAGHCTQAVRNCAATNLRTSLICKILLHFNPQVRLRGVEHDG